MNPFADIRDLPHKRLVHVRTQGNGINLDAFRLCGGGGGIDGIGRTRRRIGDSRISIGYNENDLFGVFAGTRRSQPGYSLIDTSGNVGFRSVSARLLKVSGLCD